MWWMAKTLVCCLALFSAICLQNAALLCKRAICSQAQFPDKESKIDDFSAPQHPNSTCYLFSKVLCISYLAPCLNKPSSIM